VSEGQINLFLLRRGRIEYRIPQSVQIAVHRLHHLPESQRLRFIAWQLTQKASPVAYAHLLNADEILQLSRYGVTVLPVIHNHSPAWLFQPRSISGVIPWATAVSSSVAIEVRRDLPNLPTHVVRHELQRDYDKDKLKIDRTRIRSIHKIGDSVLIGMVGKFKPQKRYELALRIIKALQDDIDARLMILAPTPDENDPNFFYFQGVKALANSLGLKRSVIFVDSCTDPRPYYAAFDCFLNTSQFEGLSIASMEAKQTGLPMVLTNVGGQQELRGEGITFLDRNAAVESFAAKIRVAATESRQAPLPRLHPKNLIPRLWSMLATYGTELGAAARKPALLFITCNLDQGGAQRSLVNLLNEIHCPYPVSVCVEQAAHREDYVLSLEERGVDCFSLQKIPALCDQLDALLSYIDSHRITAICFWHAGVRFKAMLSKILCFRNVRFLDVSPGPHLFRELDNAIPFFQRIAWSPEQYFARIDKFVSKYTYGQIPQRYGDFATKTSVIPNGVPSFEVSTPKAMTPYARPVEANPEYAVVSSGRLVPAKLIIEQLQVAEMVRKVVPQFTLTFIGKVEGAKNLEYWQDVEVVHRKLRLDGTVFFVGSRVEPSRALPEFRVFLMLSYFQGCPNASLEAMAAGLPVVANPDGGTQDQVMDGETGFLLPETDLEGIAERLVYLLCNPLVAKRMGCAGRERARSHFSMVAMARRYRDLFDEATGYSNPLASRT